MFYWDTTREPNISNVNLVFYVSLRTYGNPVLGYLEHKRNVNLVLYVLSCKIYSRFASIYLSVAKIIFT